MNKPISILVLLAAATASTLGAVQSRAATLKTWQSTQIQITVAPQTWSTYQQLCPNGQVASVLCEGLPPYPAYAGVSGASEVNDPTQAKCFNGSTANSTIFMMSATCMQVQN